MAAGRARSERVCINYIRIRYWGVLRHWARWPYTRVSVSSLVSLPFPVLSLPARRSSARRPAEAAICRRCQRMTAPRCPTSQPPAGGVIDGPACGGRPVWVAVIRRVRGDWAVSTCPPAAAHPSRQLSAARTCLPSSHAPMCRVISPPPCSQTRPRSPPSAANTNRVLSHFFSRIVAFDHYNQCLEVRPARGNMHEAKIPCLHSWWLNNNRWSNEW